MNHFVLANPSGQRSLVLASTSPFRRRLLEKLGLPFEISTPVADESRHPNEPPEDLVQRLALKKAKAVQARFPDALIIGSDQVACIEDIVLGKPGDRTRAIEQLSAASGKLVSFYTGLCLFDASNGLYQLACEPFAVQFRSLSQHQIERYLDVEKPYNCAGSFRSEGYGVVLFERMIGEDPNALVGLPLIRLVGMLAKVGIELP